MYKLITPPTSEPINAGDAKDHLRITHNLQDIMIDLLIKAARYQFESDCPAMQLMPATWGFYLDDWPTFKERRNADFLIHKYPLSAVSNIKYYAVGEIALTTWPATNYEVDLLSYPGRIKIIADSFPELNYDKLNNVQVTFICGFATAALVPTDIIAGLKLLIGHFYEVSSQVEIGHIVQETPFGYRQVVANYTKDWL